MKRGLLSIAMLLALPSFASAAFNCWSVTRGVMPAERAATLVAPADDAGLGIKTVGNITYVQAANGQLCASAPAELTFTLTPPAGIAPVVKVDGLTKAVPTVGVANTYTVAKGTKLTHTIQATYAATATQVSITTVGVAGGYIAPSKKIAYGSDTTVRITPAPGFKVTGVKINGVLNDAALAAIGDDGGDVALTGVTANTTVSATFAQTPTLTASIATANATLSIGQVLNLRGAAAVNMSTITPAYAWSVAPATGATLAGANLANATLTATAAGTYTVTLTVTDVAKNLTSTATRTVTVLTAEASDSNVCSSCHTTRDPQVTAGFNGSKHLSNPYHKASCDSCHNPAGTASHPYALSVAAAACTSCHKDPHFPAGHTPDQTNCVSCHNPHSLVTHEAGAAVTNCASCHVSTAAKFATSLHGVRPGKGTWYEDGIGETDPAPLQLGWGNFVSTPYSELPCAGCHAANDTAWTGPACTNCHNSSAPTTAVAKETCFGCHSRQAFEISPQGFGLTDVHAALACKACHSTTDMHGDGNTYKSMLDPGAITANCSNCHGANTARADVSDTIAEHMIHKGNIDCSTCHIQSVVACYNCHFDSEVSDHLKFASARFGGQGNKSWRFLVNRVMPDGSTKVFPGSMQSLMADVTAKNDGLNDGNGVTLVAIASYYSHSVTRTAALRCYDCHGTAKAKALQAGQPVDVVKWLGAENEVIAFGAPMMAAWQGPQGVIPVPENVGLLKFDFVDITDSNPALWNAGAMNLASPRVLFKRGADAIHMPDQYVKPLTNAQMADLANVDVDHTLASITTTVAKEGYNANSCNGCHSPINATYATSQHFTKTGKATWFNDHLGNTDPALEMQTGFGNYVSVGYDELPCKNCHNGNDNGPWDTDPAAGANTQAWPGPNCTECHTNRTTYGVQTTSFDAPVTKATCYGCHSRQKKEAAPVANGGAGLVDVHTNGVDDDGDGLVEDLGCMGCHSLSDVHGTGTQSASQLQWGTISAQCDNCHGEGKQQGPVAAVSRLGVAIPEHNSLHLTKLDCSTCHVESVVTCNNCHFDNEMGGTGIRKLKFASGFFGGLYNADPAQDKSWRYLLNRVMPDGTTKVYPGSMQSLYADVYAKTSPGSGTVPGTGDDQGWSHAGIAPYYSHSITKVNALKCDRCHGVQNAIDLNAGVPIRVVTWTGADDATVAPSSLGTMLKGPKGIVPVPENPRGKLLMDFVDLVDPNAALNATSDNVVSLRKLAHRDGPNSIHIPEAFAKPLTPAQINSLATPYARP